MTRYCAGHEFGCGCTDKCTKTIDIGSFSKRRDDINARRKAAMMSASAKSATGWAIIIGVSVAGLAGAYTGVKAMQHYALVNQENLS